MNKFRKFLITLLGVVSFITMSFSFIACGSTATIKVTYMVDGNPYQEVSAEMDKTITLPQEPTKEGYTFDGWYLDDITFQRPFTENSIIEERFNVDITVYAKWKLNDSGNNGDNGNVPEVDAFSFKTLVFDDENEVRITVRNNVEQFNLGEEIIATGNYKYSVDPYCSNYENGIAILRIGDNSFGIHVTKENDEEFSEYYYVYVTRLCAYKVEFSTDGGTKIETQYVDEGYLATKPEDPVKNGYDFDGWDFDFDTPITCNTYVHADYTLATYTITYDLDGFNVEVPEDNATSYTIKTSTITLKDISGDVKVEESNYTYGYTFMRWECDGQEITKIQQGSYGDITIKAVFEKTHIYFGEYPQRYVGHETDVDFAGSTKDERGYYLASNNCYYAQITASLYDSGGRKFFTSGHQVTSGVKYQFKVEPIKWRILSEDDGTLFLLCENALDNPKFDNIKLNEYQTSNIRSWLNGDFYNIAFSTTEKQKILTTEVDNSAKSANPYGKPTEFENDGNYGNLTSTFDKVFLLSVEEATNPNYGFNNEYNASDLSRRKYATDYAIARGVFYNDTGFSIEGGHGKVGQWWLRSVVPASAYIRTVSGWYGNIGDGGSTDTTRLGVVPAIRIQL